MAPKFAMFTKGSNLPLNKGFKNMFELLQSCSQPSKWPSWISRRERITVENISWSTSTKECCWTWLVLILWPVTDNCSSWIPQRSWLNVEIISWLKLYGWPEIWICEQYLLDLQSDVPQTELQSLARDPAQMPHCVASDLGQHCSGLSVQIVMVKQN